MSCEIDVYHKQSLWKKMFFRLEQCSILFKVTSDLIAHWYAILNAMIFAINFCNAMEIIICELKFSVMNHY